ncbi:MAG: OmpA family protein [Candidatus Accumulibacter sp.]|uniref:OmpA family protein n=1 Tax=Candidatus Accumulibacter proximus TaxID=2954385 RepID=A0A935PV79_9PROT|nr:OmpA family protein [Candidatus Accumulibacter proximus]
MRPTDGLLCVLALSLAACAQISDRVVLLPGPDGRSGALSITAAAGEVVLSEPYTGVDVAGSQLTRQKTSPGMVHDAYGRLLAMQPLRPRIFVVHFKPGKDVLRPDSQAMLANIVAALANFPAGEAVVIGHTDRMGSAADNMRLSLRRAAAVRELLVSAGVPREAISVVGRGELDPAVITGDEVAEPLNRRVEVKLR